MAAGTLRNARCQACIKGGQPWNALEVYEQLITKGGVRTDEVISTLVVQAHAMKGEFDEAFQVLTVRGYVFLVFSTCLALLVSGVACLL